MNKDELVMRFSFQPKIFKDFGLLERKLKCVKCSRQFLKWIASNRLFYFELGQNSKSKIIFRSRCGDGIIKFSRQKKPERKSIAF